MKFSVACLIFIALALLEEVESKCGCRVRYRAIGCYNDKGSDRTLPELLITERDRSMKAYNGYDIDWYNWDEYLPVLTCRCAEAAMKKGYKIFGLQFWGECWSGPSPAAADRYDKYGKASTCYGPGYKKCKSDSADNNCVGDNFHNFVYEIEIYDCPVKFDRLGCYKDNHGNVRPLPDYIMTDRDTSRAFSSGRKIDWFNYDTYLPDFACRCAQIAAKKGYSTFGVQYYGECWSGPDDDTYFKDGVSSRCQNQCYKQCRSYDPFCTGQNFASFVYRITKDVCELKYQALRCFNEYTKERALDELILDDVNPESSKFTGMVSTNFKDWEKYMQGLVCRCARKIKEKGYTTFGIGNGGECWSGANASETFDRHEPSFQCYYNQTTPCSSNTCAGGKNTIFVYQLV